MLILQQRGIHPMTRFIIRSCADKQAMILDSKMNDRVVATCQILIEAVAIALHLNGEHGRGDRTHRDWLDAHEALSATAAKAQAAA